MLVSICRSGASSVECSNAFDKGASMHAFRKVRVFLQVLLQSLSRALSSLGSYEKIAFTERLYLRIPTAELTLMSVASGGSDVIQSMNLSVNEATEIVRSIKRACDLQELVEIRVGELSWKTDGRLQSNPDKIIIVFGGPLGYTREIANREEVVTAVREFSNRFGLN